MRTTLDIDEDLVLTAKQLANQKRTTMGKVVSNLMRKALAREDAQPVRNGIRPFAPKAGAPKVTLELVNRLRDEA
jgi:hypothetical protein